MVVRQAIQIGGLLVALTKDYIAASKCNIRISERLIKSRLEEEIDRNGGQSNGQYGIVKERSTTHAIRVVAEMVRICNRKWVV